MTNDIRSLIANDGFAMSFQSMGQYRTALLREIDNTANQTNPLDEKELIDLVSSLWVTANSLDHFGQCHEVPPPAYFAEPLNSSRSKMPELLSLLVVLNILGLTTRFYAFWLTMTTGGLSRGN